MTFKTKIKDWLDTAGIILFVVICVIPMAIIYTLYIIGGDLLDAYRYKCQCGRWPWEYKPEGGDNE